MAFLQVSRGHTLTLLLSCSKVVRLALFTDFSGTISNAGESPASRRGRSKTRTARLYSMVLKLITPIRSAGNGDETTSRRACIATEFSNIPAGNSQIFRLSSKCRGHLDNAGNSSNVSLCIVFTLEILQFNM